ncbi:hypothetical protein Pelo_6116 [Pelomyxa schiedti]|nr:hypothetical protein Pelo_6116 [Pelomyxa schiedti]
MAKGKKELVAKLILIVCGLAFVVCCAFYAWQIYLASDVDTNGSAAGGHEVDLGGVISNAVCILVLIIICVLCFIGALKQIIAVLGTLILSGVIMFLLCLLQIIFYLVGRNTCDDSSFFNYVCDHQTWWLIIVNAVICGLAALSIVCSAVLLYCKSKDKPADTALDNYYPSS